MLTGRRNFYLKSWHYLLVFTVLISSCGVVPKNYPSNRPFVFKTTVKVNGKFSNEERDNLTSKIKAQLDDSMQARTASKLFYSILKKPAVYEQTNAEKSVQYIKALLGSLGYFQDSVKYDTLVKKVGKDQLRTYVNFSVTPGNQVLLDSISYNLQAPDLQLLTLKNEKESYLIKGTPFAKSIISTELDRLVELYRNNGYLKFGREEMIGIWDTLDIDALKPNNDIFEQVELLKRLQEKKNHPTANLEIRLRDGFDSSKLKRYYIGKVTVYPEFLPDTTGFTPSITTYNGIEIISYTNSFHPSSFVQKIYFKRGDIYRGENYNKTLNQLSAISAWKLVNIEQIPRENQDTADIIIRLTPGSKREAIANVEGSSNQSIISGSLLGIALNFGIQNRNVAKRAIQSNTNIRLGIETGRDTLTDVHFIQSSQFVLSHTLYFPKPLPNAKWIPASIKDNFKSVLAMNLANTKRRELFDLTSISGSWGYDFRQKNALFSLRLLNVEFNSIQRKPKLDELINNNALLKNIFVDGLIASTSGAVSITNEKKNHISNYRFNIEESGLISGMIHSKLFDTNLYRFIKVDADISHKISFKKSSLAMRFFAGFGYELGSTINENKRYSLPLFRQYFAGGPNSMRAWAIRKLGPGSSVQEFGNTGLPERYGDLQIETNLEYRFPFFTVAGFKVNGALFTDIGNIWYVKKAPGRKPEEIFNFNRLGKDLAVGVGTGLRIDFSYFVIRLDYSIKAKDPCPSPANAAYKNKWFGYKNWSDMDQFQLGINYPFNL